jgi:ribosome recycling factor
MDHLKKADKDGEVSKEEAKRAEDRLQKLTDDIIKQLDDVFGSKEKEILGK